MSCLDDLPEEPGTLFTCNAPSEKFRDLETKDLLDVMPCLLEGKYTRSRSDKVLDRHFIDQQVFRRGQKPGTINFPYHSSSIGKPQHLA